MRAKTFHHIQLGLSSSKPTGYSPQQIRRAYKLNKLIKRGITGKGQHIAIIDAFGSPTVKKDLQVFSKRFGLPRPKLKIYYPQGKPSKVNPDWALETALDVQWAHALAPDATIHLVVTKSNSLADLFRGVCKSIGRPGRLDEFWG
jgi:subtilase family serine protease